MRYLITMSLLKIRYLLLIIYKYLVITTSYAAVKNSVPQSPCPSVLDYEYDYNNKLQGYIATSAPKTYTNLLTLDVQISVGNKVQGSTGNIVLLNTRIAEDVHQNKLLLYKLEFPSWQNIPPRITKISMNGNQICFGQPFNLNDVPGITTINFQHQQPLTASTDAESQNSETSTPSIILNQRAQEAPRTSPPEVLEVWSPHILNSNQNGISYSNPNQNVPQRPHNPVYPNTVRPTFDTSTPEVPEVWKPIHSKPPVYGIPFQPSTLRPTFETSPPKVPEVWNPPTDQSNQIPMSFSNVCGISNAIPLSINGNKNVPSGSHPWVAALFKQDESLTFTCGSTLISKWHVVTAAHCVKFKLQTPVAEDFWVVLGRKNIKQWSPTDGAQIIQAESTHPHPDFKFDTGDADIAVLRLSKQVIFTRLVKPICLWTGDNNQKLIIEKKGTIISWGTDETGVSYTGEPSQLTFPVVSEEECLRSNLGFQDITSTRTFCAGYRNNSGPCTGDSGSGFFMKRDGRWVLRGIVSLALSGADRSCDVDEYSVLVDATAFTEWLLPILIR